MAQRMFTTLVIVATVFTVAIGCARTSARTSSTPAASPSSASTDLVGTWHGSAWELAGGIAAARTDATSTSLVHRGDDLYGMLDSAVEDLDVQLDLKRVR
ncbi:MAG: hypothetical protein AUI04_02655 [Candidatus Rokubacteria bacterium 13_2_20CM_2_64_8]|nr:MAG: hypothetical protein AUI04_02655 [Candidatus Rokubacteria bacterium 13_2_20CM_2_64_8]